MNVEKGVPVLLTEGGVALQRQVLAEIISNRNKYTCMSYINQSDGIFNLFHLAYMTNLSHDPPNINHETKLSHSFRRKR